MFMCVYMYCVYIYIYLCQEGVASVIATNMVSWYSLLICNPWTYLVR